MQVKELVEMMKKYHQPNDYIHVQYWSQEDILDFIADSHEDVEVLDIPMDAVSYITRKLDDLGPDGCDGVSMAVSDLYDDWLKLQARPDYESDTPLGQQYGDGAEVDQ